MNYDTVWQAGIQKALKPFAVLKPAVPAAGKTMQLFFLIFFIVLGALDLLYGVLYKDQLSIMAGGAIVVITVYVWKKKK